MYVVGDWDSDMSLGDAFDDPESCECSVAFNRDECNSCGHDLACGDAYCIDEEHRHRLSRSCDCLSGEEVDECGDCFHDLGCSIFDCDNENHDKVKNYGNPKFCNCHRELEKAECSNCGHTIECLEDECSECFEPDHIHRFEYFKHPEHCECSDFQAPITCDSCNHDLNCPENDAYCSTHLKTERPTGVNVLVHDNGALAPKASYEDAKPDNSKKRGSYWTREEDEELASQYLEGASDVEISQLLGRSVRAVQSRLVKICFEANGIEISNNLKYPQRAMAHWAETEDQLLEGLSSTKVKLYTMSKALERSELSVAYRLVARRMAKPGNLDLVFYYEREDSTLGQETSEWTIHEYLELRERFQSGEGIRDLAAKSGKAELSCFRILYTMGDISNTHIDIALKSAAGTSYSSEEA